MSSIIKYSILFKLFVNHLYYLNKGITEFSSLDDGEKEKQLESYNFNSFFKIIPTSETSKQLSGLNLFFKTSNTGFVVLSKVTGKHNNIPFITLEADIAFTFIIQKVDSRFFNYTNLDINKFNRLYYFSNRRINPDPPRSPLIRRLDDNININNSYLLSDEDAQVELEKLSAAEKKNIFGIIRIFLRGDKGRLHVITSQKRLIIPPRTFELQFKNRLTFWRYIFRQDQTVAGSDDVIKENADAKVLITKMEHPLTDKGFISIDLKGNELPNPNANLIIPGISIDTFYSEIYM